MPKKMNFQFYATHDEILRFVDDVIDEHSMYVYLVRVLPTYAVVEIKHNQQYDLNQWTFALFSACRREIYTKETYAAYSGTIHGDLILYIGEETETQLRESSIGTAVEYSINPVWVKYIGQLKKRCRRGAYLVTPQNRRQCYPNIRYSEGALAAYRKGKTIRPIVGWNCVELVSD